MYLFIFNIYTFNVKVLYKNILKLANNYRKMCDLVNFFNQLTALIYNFITLIQAKKIIIPVTEKNKNN